MRPIWRMPVLVAFAAATLGSAAAAEPGTPAYRVEWKREPGAEDCPDARAFEAEVARHLTKAVVDAGAPRCVHASVSRGRRFTVTLRLEDASGRIVGSRSIESDSASCEAIFESAAFAVALAIDDDAGGVAASRDARSGHIPASDAPEHRAGVVPEAHDAGNVASGGESFRLESISAALTAYLRVLPDSTAGAALGARARSGIPVDLTGSIEYAAPASADPVGRERLRVQLTAVTLGVAMPWVVAPSVRADVLGGVTAGVLGVKVSNAVPRGPGAHTFVAGRFGIGSRVRIERSWFLYGAAQALVPFQRWRLLSTGVSGVLWQQPAIGLATEFGVVWAVPEK